MLRALLLLACTAKVAAFAQAPAGEPGCVDLDPEVIQLAQAVQDDEVEAGMPTMTSCADVAASGGCADEEVAAYCCATCALPQRMTYSAASDLAREMRCMIKKIQCYFGPIPQSLYDDLWGPNYSNRDIREMWRDNDYRMRQCGNCYYTPECSSTGDGPSTAKDIYGVYRTKCYH